MLGFNNALRGLIQAFSSERNFTVQFIFFIAVVILGFFFEIANYEWIAILLISAVVLSLELLNSSIEKLCDLYSTNHNPKIKWIKDVSAAAVLISSLLSIAIGLIIFLPKVFELIDY